MAAPVSHRFDELCRPDRYDHRLETERYSEAVSARPSIWQPIRPLNSFERWYRSLTVAESIRLTNGDFSICVSVDSEGQFTYPWRVSEDVHQAP